MSILHLRQKIRDRWATTSKVHGKGKRKSQPMERERASVRAERLEAERVEAAKAGASA